MGADKALLRLPEGGPTLIERTVAAARAAGTDDVVVVTRAGQRLPEMDARLVVDEQPGAGPLAGLATGLATGRRDVALVLACDLPYLSVPLLRWMAEMPRDAFHGCDALVPRLPDEGGENPDGWEPLHALYTRACLAPIRAALARGERRMTSFFPHIRLRPLTAADMRPYDPALRSTRSANTPKAWTEAARWLRAHDAAILPRTEETV